MFYNWYQTGASIELFNPNSKDLMSTWRFEGQVKKVYDKTIKSNVHFMNTAGISKMIIPKSKNETLGILQGYMVFQFYLFQTKNFSIEIAISDTQKVKHRLIFSTYLKDFSINYFTCLIPLGQFPIGIWCNLSIDVLNFVTHCFKEMTFKSIDSVILSASCKVRRIFTMRNKITDGISVNNNDKTSISSISNDNTGEIPSQYQLPKADGIEVMNINLNSGIVLKYIKAEYGTVNIKSKSKSPKEKKSNNSSRLHSNINREHQSFFSNKSPNKQGNQLQLKFIIEKPKFEIKNKKEINGRKEIQRYKINPEELEINKPVIISSISNTEKTEDKKPLNTYNYPLKSKDTKGSDCSIEEMIVTNSLHENKPPQKYDKDTIFVDHYSRDLKDKTQYLNEEKSKNNTQEIINEILRESVIFDLVKKESRDRPYSPPLTKISKNIKY